MEGSNWLSEMGMEESSFLDQYQMNTFGDITPQQIAAAFGKNYQQSYSSESFSYYPNFSPTPLDLDVTQTCFERPTKQHMTTCSWNSCTTEQSTPGSSSSPTMLAFGDSNSPTSHFQYYGTSVGVQIKEEVISPANKNVFSKSKMPEGPCLNQNYTPKAGQGNKRATVPSNKSPARDHVLAERKRREKLSQRFIALSAILPGLKKMDKASVLEDSIKYVKELKERVKILEEQTAKKTTESVVFVKKYQIPSYDDSSSTDNNSTNEALPEIEARFSERNVLIRIHCEKQKGVLVEALAEIEKFNLSVANSSAIPFGSSTLDITVMAQMDEDFNMVVTDLVKKLRASFLRFM